MTKKPSHKRCQVCDRVTSRYSHTERAGAVVLKVWIRDELNGEVRTDGGRTVLCNTCADTGPG